MENPVRLYKTTGIGVATLFGSTIAGGYLISQNLKALGRPEEAKKYLLLSIAVTFGCFALAMLIPDNWKIPNSAFTVPQIFVVIQWVQMTMKSELETRKEQGQGLISNWKAFGISLIFLVAILIVIFGSAYVGVLLGVL